MTIKPSVKIWKSKQPRILVRRVVGSSMSPALEPSRIVLAVTAYANLTPGSVVILRHNGLEKIKRVSRIRGGKIFVEGDNKKFSRDSREFGWLPVDTVVGKVFWPRI